MKKCLPRAVALDPAVLSEDEAVKEFTEVLHHVVPLRLAMNEKVETNFLLEPDNEFDFFLDEVVILFLRDLALGELGPSSTNLFSLLKGVLSVNRTSLKRLIHVQGMNQWWS